MFIFFTGSSDCYEVNLYHRELRDVCRYMVASGEAKFVSMVPFVRSSNALVTVTEVVDPGLMFVACVDFEDKLLAVEAEIERRLEIEEEDDNDDGIDLDNLEVGELLVGCCPNSGSLRRIKVTKIMRLEQLIEVNFVDYGYFDTLDPCDSVGYCCYWSAQVYGFYTKRKRQEGREGRIGSEGIELEK